MTDRLDEMVERAFDGHFEASEEGHDELTCMKAALTAAGVPALLAEVERLRDALNQAQVIGLDMATKASKAEAELLALRARIEAAPQGVVVGVKFEEWDRPAWCVMDDRDSVPLTLGGQRVHLLPSPSGEVQS